MRSEMLLKVSPLPQSRSKHLKQIFFSIVNHPVTSDIYFIITVICRQINRFVK